MKAYYLFLDCLCTIQIHVIGKLDPQAFSIILNSLKEGLNSVDILYNQVIFKKYFS